MHFKGLDLNLLVAMDALLVEKNITRAGERLYLSQSATSGALGRLREFFHDELLVQVGHKMVLTPLAESLQEPVRQVLLQTETIINNNPAFSPETCTRQFRLMMSDYTAAVLMPEALHRVQQLAPGVTIELLSNTETPAEQVERGEVDLLIMPKEYLSGSHPSEELFADEFICAVWSGNELVQNHISLEQYLSLGHVAVRFGNIHAVGLEQYFLARFGYKRRIEVVLAAFNLLPHFVIGTNRIATMQRRLASLYASHFPLRLVPPPIELPCLTEAMQWHRSRDLDPGNAWLRRLLKDTVEQGSERWRV
jgi:DNA-binding transcriptional LysR family regulator